MEAILNSEFALRQQQDAQIEKMLAHEGARLFNFIRKQVRDLEDAEDIFQDVLFQFTNTIRSYDSIENDTAWLFRVARNRIIDSYRKKKPETFSREFAARESEDGPLSLAEILPDLNGLADEIMTRNMVWEVIEEGLDEMPEAQREVFVMHEFEDMSFKEIAEITGAGQNTLLSRKRYAVLFLREKLQQLYSEIF
ncbi:MAG: RNA polymerase sigma factor [Bacteroidia bacterium]|nr:RNA polymerase sigma factor [Bacteroidia bacterium]